MNVSFDPDFSIETAQSGAQTTIRIAGELDSATCQSFAEHFERLVAEAQARREVVIDLRRVTFVDSAGIRTMVLIQRAAAERRIPLVLRPPPEPVIGLLKLAGVAERMQLAPERDDDPAPPGGVLEQHDLQFAREPTAPARARAEIRRVVARRLAKPAVDAVTLLTSELVTNAVIHPERVRGEMISLLMTAYDDRVRVEVSDFGVGFDPARPATPSDTGGRGLFLVDAIAMRWGTRRTDPDRRFTVWFELAAAADEAQAAGANTG